MIGKEFVELLEGRAYDFFAGVPCSLIEGVLNALERHPRLPYVAAVREDVAVGLAAGAWLGGKRPAVLIQNSGLGTGLNALASLALLYKLPSLLVVTWRGYGGTDAPEHLLTGAITPHLLDLLGIRHRTLAPTSVEADLDWATREADRRMEPVALLVPPGVFEQERDESSGSGGISQGVGRIGKALADAGGAATASARFSDETSGWHGERGAPTARPGGPPHRAGGGRAGGAARRDRTHWAYARRSEGTAQ